MSRGTSHSLSIGIRSIAAAIAFGAIAAGADAAEINTDPGDYVALPAGTDLGLVYLQYANRNANYSHGDKTAGSFKLETDIGLLRWVHFMEVGGFTIDPQIIVPFGRVDLKTAFGPLQPTTAEGVGDPLVGGTLWLLNRQAEKEWFGVSAFASVPIGSYKDSNGPVNVGENRWKGIFQAAYVRPIVGDFMLDLVGEYSVYGDNDDYIGMTREQDASYGFQTHVRYVISPSTHVALSYFHDYGGTSTLNGVSQDDRMSNDRWLATFASFVTPTTQMQIQGGQAISVENGAKESARVNLRLLKVF